MLVAIVILGLIMGAMARTLTSSMFSVQGQQAQVRASALVQEVLEEAAGIAWGDLGLCESEATGLYSSGTYTFADNTTEPLVLLPDSSSLCDPLDEAPLRAARTHERDGIQYDTITVVTWKDEDGVGSSDDLKHVLVRTDWTDRGRPRTTLAETYLAPNALEAVLATEIIHAGSQTYTYLDKETGLTDTVVVLRVVAVRPQSAVSVAWRDSNGELVSRNMGSPQSDRLVWELTIPRGSPDFNVNRLANGETLFEFTATDADNASTFTAFDRGLFLLEPAGLAFTLLSPLEIRVDPQGSLCSPVTLSVYGRGLLSSDIVQATWSEGLGQVSLLSVPDEDPSGAVFEQTYDTGSISPPADGTEKTITVSVTGTRVADDQTVVSDPAESEVKVVKGCA